MRLSNLDATLRALPSLMRDFSAPWAIAGGSAIDLFLGRVTRPHADVELAIFRCDQSLLHRQLRDWTFHKVVGGQLVPWISDETLSLPIHEIHARSNEDRARSIEFLLNERTADDWVFRRDARVWLPVERAIVRSDVGLPILAPEIVLLYKSKAPRPRDVADFESSFDALGPERRLWLRAALAASDPGHPWVAVLPFRC